MDIYSSINKIVYSPKPFIKLLRSIFIVLIISVGSMTLIINISLMKEPYIYLKDYVADYLPARAILIGEKPYESLSNLSEKYFGDIPDVTMFPHPTPHPPLVILINLPLALFDYFTAVHIWLLIQLSCLLLISFLLMNYVFNIKRVLISGLLFFVMLSWYPIAIELLYGQLMIILLLLMLISWISLKHNRMVLGGVFLGLAVSFKLIFWPILLWLLFTKRWKPVFFASITILLINVIAILVFGIEQIIYYYAVVSNEVMPYYRALVSNYSIWSLGWRIFEGVEPQNFKVFVYLPVLYNPYLALLTSSMLSISIFITGIYSSLKVNDFDISMNILFCLVLLISPLTWGHYLPLLLFPISILINRLYLKKFPTNKTIILLVILLFIIIPDKNYADLSLIISGYIYEPITVPFWVTIFTLIPTLAILALALYSIFMDNPSTGLEISK